MPSDEPPLRDEVRALRTELAVIEERLAAIEDRLDADASDDSSPSPDVDGHDAPDTSAVPDSTDRPTPQPSVGDERSPETTAEPPVAADESSEVEEPSTVDAGDGDPDEPVDDPTEPVDDPDEPADDPIGMADGRTIEVDAGIRWLGIVGALTLVLGVVFVVRYAIEVGLIGYLGRVLLGVLFGLGLVALGLSTRRRAGYERWGEIVAGAGIAITYISVYAAHGFEAYRDTIGVPPAAVVVMLALVAGGAAVFAVREDVRFLAAEAFLLGYLGALLGPGFETLGLLYALLLAGGVLAIVTTRAWIELPVGGVVLAYATYLRWGGDGLIEGAGYLGGVFCLYLGAAYLVSDADRSAGWAVLVSLLTLLNALAAAFLLDVLVLSQGEFATYADVGRPLLYLAFAATFAGVHVVSSRRPRRRNWSAPYLTVLFVVIATVAWFDTFGITLAFATLAVVLVAGALRIGDPPFRYAGHAVAGLAVGKVLLLDLWLLPEFDPSTPIAVASVPALLAVTVALAGISMLLSRHEDRLAAPERFEHLPASVGYAWAALVVLAAGLVIEVWSLFWTTVVAVGLVVAMVGLSRVTNVPAPRVFAHPLAVGIALKVLLFDGRNLPAFTLADPLVASRPASFLLTAGVFAGLAYALARRADRLHRVEDLGSRFVPITYAWMTTGLVVVLLGLELGDHWTSAAWGVLGVALIAAGLRTEIRTLRFQGFTVLGGAVLKAFLFDTRGLDPLPRALSFLALGIVLLVASYVYARHGRRLLDSETAP